MLGLPSLVIGILKETEKERGSKRSREAEELKV